ncbi:PIG-L deacetylase family protein [Kiloniella antarctica]|uniref:PIG-L deacetylase family protein n=1 Tax=Kiloniella antarctica TaxID=1550907 RepID=A0ABW5BLW2_9PROT
MINRILVVAAHPDDEILGCGGTLARHVKGGDTVDIVFLSDGVTSRDRENSVDEIERRKCSAFKAAEIIGARKPVFGDFKDQMLDSYSLIEIVKFIETILKQVGPNIIYTHDFSDLNVDHLITHRAVMTACRPLPENQIKSIYAFECVSSTEWSVEVGGGTFVPNYFVDISSTINMKMAALRAYEFEMRPSPHSRSFENVQSLATFRGHSVGVLYAEAFRLIRGLRFDTLL